MGRGAGTALAVHTEGSVLSTLGGGGNGGGHCSQKQEAIAHGFLFLPLESALRNSSGTHGHRISRTDRQEVRTLSICRADRQEVHAVYLPS